MITLTDAVLLVAMEPPNGDSHGDPHAEDAAHAADAAHASGGLPQLDMATWPGQLFWLTVTFSLLFLLLWRVVLPRIRNAIEERRDRIASDLDAASDLKTKAEESEAEYERLLSEARGKAHGIAMDSREAVDKEVAADAADADAEIAKKQAEAEKRIAEMREKALAEVRTVAIDATDAIVSELTGTDIDAKTVAAAVDARG